jgi:uncharacterized phage protein gp47/JayE
MKKSYSQIVENILEQITKGLANEKHLFDSSKVKYGLEFKPVKDIVKVEGILKGERHVFVKDTDYKLDNSMVAWIGTDKPDDKSEFKVSYTFGQPSGLTDVNTGSVLRTIVEAISREIEFLYLQMDQVYKSGFIDTASGNALDLVVSILGIQRKLPTHAMGDVTFWRDTDPPEIPVSGEAILYDGRDIYELSITPAKRIVAVNGLIKGSKHSFKEGQDYVFEPATNSLQWLQSAQKPDNRTSFSVDYTAYQKIVIPTGTKVSTFSRQQQPPENARIFETIKESTLEKAPSGRWEFIVQVKSVTPGESGNVIAGSITVMPKPPIGVEHVINSSNLAGGAEAEDDESLRSRAKNALEVAAKATMGSLRAALEDVEGLQSPPLIQEMHDGVPGIVKVVVDGGDDREIEKVIEDTRAAGIHVEFTRPKAVLVDISMTLTLRRKIKQEPVKSTVEDKIKSFISSLKIGEDIIFNQIVSALLTLPGVLDIQELIVDAYREQSSGSDTRSATAIHSTKENIAINEDERAYVRMVTVMINTT